MTKIPFINLEMGNVLDQPALALAIVKIAATGTETERLYAALAIVFDAMRRAREQIRAGDLKAADATLSDLLQASDFLLAKKTGKDN
jgi:hypothetical protein